MKVFGEWFDDEKHCNRYYFFSKQFLSQTRFPPSAPAATKISRIREQMGTKYQQANDHRADGRDQHRARGNVFGVFDQRVEIR